MNIPLSYLTERTTLEDAIAANMYAGKPFGHANDDWERLLAKLKDGDELWYFAPPDKTVMQFWGLALVRDKQVVSTVITELT